MIRVEFLERVVGCRARRLIAVLEVSDDGSHVLSGATWPGGVSLLDRAQPDGRLTLVADPVRWARHCHKAFRNGYVCAVISEEAG